MSSKQLSHMKFAASALLAIGLGAAAQGATVLIDYGPSWAGGATGNQATIDFFNNHFQNPTVISGDYSDTANAGVQAAIASADVLVLTRTTSSAAYDTNDATFYSSLTIPVVDLTSYSARSNRLFWEGGDVSAQAIDGNEVTVTAAGAGVFGSAGSFDWYGGTGTFDAAGSGTVGGGQILATIGGSHFVVGWRAGDAVASGAVQSGDRLLFNISGNGNNLPDTAAGLQAMLNAIEAYTPLVQSLNTNQTSSLATFEAESGTLGAQFGTNTLGGVTNITISPTGGGNSPGGAARVATYSITFPKAGTYYLYARLYVGPDPFNDDSFFYATSFGTKSHTNDADWITVNGLANAVGFANSSDVVTGGGSGAGSGVWKWINLSQYNDLEAGVTFTVSGSLTQTFQIGGREDGLYLDKFVFAPSDIPLTVSNLDSGTLPEAVYSTNTFDGPLGMAIHRFDETAQSLNRDGAGPVGLTALGDAVLCGTTFSGGSQGEGTVFCMNLDGTAFTNVSALSATANAGFPQGGLAASGSSFYGTTLAGGVNKAGAVFAGQTNGSITVLHSFDTLSSDTALNVEGAYPCGWLAQSGSTLYGAASAGGPNGNGTLFSLSTSGGSLTVLHAFSALDAASGTNNDGTAPRDGLVLSGSTLYGTASGGGMNGAGVVFAIGIDGTGYTVLHHFAAVDPFTTTNSGGAFPCSGLVLSNNVLYGTTLGGGAGGKGTVFAISTGGSGFTALHNFPATDPVTGTNVGGAAPSGRLMLSGNVLYGTASAGGSGAAGTVFSLDVTGPTFSTIHNFEPVAATGTNTYGAFPTSPLLRLGNTLYGPAFGGGPGGAGTIFSLPMSTQASVGNVSGGNLAINFVGAPNSTNVVQATSDLSATPVLWQNVSTNVADGSGWWQFIDFAISSNRFYRAKSL
jgi:uncharacterized repeat protein (TIGR03803 family)